MNKRYIVLWENVGYKTLDDAREAINHINTAIARNDLETRSNRGIIEVDLDECVDGQDIVTVNLK